MSGHLILCGLPGVGKTTLGEKAAEQLSLPFIDTDKLIEERSGLPVREAYLKLGETTFRELEYELIQLISDGPTCLLSTGGGCIEHPKTRELLPDMGWVFHLMVSIDVLRFRHLMNGPPAFLNGESFDSLAKRRLILYSSISNEEIDLTDGEQLFWESISNHHMG